MLDKQPAPFDLRWLSPAEFDEHVAVLQKHKYIYFHQHTYRVGLPVRENTYKGISLKNLKYLFYDRKLFNAKLMVMVT